jgi:hypothetical protein
MTYPPNGYGLYDTAGNVLGVVLRLVFRDLLSIEPAATIRKARDWGRGPGYQLQAKVRVAGRICVPTITADGICQRLATTIRRMMPQPHWFSLREGCPVSKFAVGSFSALSGAVNKRR